MEQGRLDAAVTQARLALEEVEASAALTQRLSRTGSWTWYPADPSLGEWSPEVYTMLGYRVGEVEASFSSNIARIHPDDVERYLREAADIADEGKRFNVEYRYLLPDGTIRHVHALGRRVSEELYVGTVSDITGRRLAEEALRKARSELALASRLTTLGVLATSISHELNQPLTAILANAAATRRWLERGPEHIDRAKEGLVEMMADCRRAKEVVMGLRGLARKSEPEFGDVDLAEAILEVATLCRAEFDMRSGTLSLDVEAIDRPIAADRVQLQQVVLTLIMDCLARAEAGGGPRDVRVLARADGAGASVTIADAVPYQANVLLETSIDALGAGRDPADLGLAVARAIIDGHGGELTFVPFEKGGAYRVHLPTRTGP
ncbi:PAS domain-containing protein [Sphingomonas xinjiangensis]|uniref:histidine kinase n=1 Tax=Sphingomonas xinjiangensis TaxID=643568 RepID=A0A840YS14_9SPHN|nr:PAS domain S-box-containing protein [Sphingomonas xinjiangensis]